MQLKNIKLIQPLKCKKDDKATEVAKKLRESAHRHIYVVDEKEYPIGIISTTDINNKLVAEGKDPNSIVAEKLMSQPLEVYDINDNPLEVYKDMTKNKRMGCAVTDNKKFVGVISLNRLAHFLTS